MEAEAEVEVMRARAVTPEEMAQILRDSGMAEDDVLDLLRLMGERFGWTKELNRTGLLYLKPHAPAGQEREA